MCHLSVTHKHSYINIHGSFFPNPLLILPHLIGFPRPDGSSLLPYVSLLHYLFSLGKKGVNQDQGPTEYITLVKSHVSRSDQVTVIKNKSFRWLTFVFCFGLK